MTVDIDEGKKAEEQPGFVAQLQATLNVIPAYAWYAAPSGGLTFVNKRTADYLGLPKDHPLRFGIDIGAQWDAHIPLLHPDDREESRKAWSTCLRTGETAEFSQRVRNAQGDYRWFLSRAEPLRASDGNLLLWVGVNLDIEELKRTEQALRDSEYKLRQIIDTIPGHLWSLGPDGEPTHVGQNALDYSGMRFEDFKNRRWEAFIHPADFPKTLHALSHAIQTGTSYQAVHRLRRADGEYRWHYGHAEPLRDRQGNIIQWYGLSIDIDEAKKAEQALRTSEAKIRRLVEANIIGIFIWDFDGQILEANEAFLHIVGYDHEDLVAGRIRWTDLTPPEWRDNDTRLIQEQKVTGTLQPFEKEYFRKDGSRVPVLIGVATFEEGGDQGVAFVVDLTERKSAEERLRQLEGDLAHMNRVSMMGELAASLSHEITQPIASARNNARAAQNFLDMQPPDLGEVREALSCVVGDTDRAGDMIDRIRDHMKKAPPRKAQFDLNEAINEVIVLRRSAIIKNGISVQTRLSEGLFPVHGDRVQLQQVVLNLLLNAVEAMGSVEAKPRDLLISTEQDHTGVLVAVRDSGPGIDPSHLERVFDAFHTTKSSGMGMGLSICRSIIDAHGGRLWAEANEPRGVIFQFTLPGVP
jgi:PAS domain S-box-containing protein